MQRRAEIVKINAKKDVNLSSKTIIVRQSKAENYDKPVFIDISMGDELYNTILASIASDIQCPYIVHARQRQTTETRQNKPHPFAVLPDYLTRQYSKVRDKVGVYNHLPKNERPGIHSLRALGIWLYTKAGYPDEYIMALSGHASAKMKAHYYEGHEKPVPVKVAADLSLSNVDFSDIDWETDLSKTLKNLADNEG